MRNNALTDIELLLQKKQIEYEIKKYPFSVNSAKEAAEYLHVDEKQLFKTILVKTNQSKYLLLLLPSSEKIDVEKIRKLIGNNIVLADKKEIEKVTGYEIGAVSPLKTKNKFDIYIDVKNQNFETVGVATGIKGYEIFLKPSDLINFISAKVASFVKDN